jgi:hypothetical protein
VLGLFVLIRTFLSLSLQLEDSSGQSRPAVDETGLLRTKCLSFFGLVLTPISYVVIMWITEKVRGRRPSGTRRTTEFPAEASVVKA